MTRSELITNLAKQFPQLTQEDAEDSVMAILKGMTQALAKRDRIEIRGFGSFTVHLKPARWSRNPKTGEQFVAESKYSPHFKPGNILKSRVNS